MVFMGDLYYYAGKALAKNPGQRGVMTQTARKKKRKARKKSRKGKRR